MPCFAFYSIDIQGVNGIVVISSISVSAFIQYAGYAVVLPNHEAAERANEHRK